MCKGAEERRAFFLSSAFSCTPVSSVDSSGVVGVCLLLWWWVCSCGGVCVWLWCCRCAFVAVVAGV